MHFDRPRERLRTQGAERLSDAELVALILGTGSTNDPVTEVAQRLLHREGGVLGLRAAGLGALSEHKGVGATKAARLIAALELGRRSFTSVADEFPRLVSSVEVAAFLHERMAYLDHERFLAVPMDTRHRPICVTEIGQGGSAHCPVHPSDAFRAVLRQAAPAVIFAHNHPSGDPSPSDDDYVLTDRLEKAAKLLGISLLDHVIMARNGHFSFLDAGVIRSHR